MTGGSGVDLAAFDLLTFDCYGTLIDWEAGIVAALEPLLADHGVEPPPEEILALHARFEPVAQQGGFRPYREILAEVVDRFGEHYGFVPSARERAALAASVGDWPVFPDTVSALRRLAGRFRLAVLSNIDDDLFAVTERRLGAGLEGVVTAEQVRSYKPAPTHFETALERFGVDRSAVLHVAQSLFHDIAPARALGWWTVWIDRRGDRPGSGATPPAAAEPDLALPDLASLAALAD